MPEIEGGLLKNEIETDLQKKSTEELYKIWKGHKESGWTEEYYRVAQQILKERIAQEPTEKDKELEEDDNESEETDTYANLNSAVKLASWANYLSWFFLAYAAFALISNIISLVNSQTYNASSLVSFAGSLFTPLIAGFFAIFLKGISYFVYLLMDIEDNTRHGTNTNEPKTAKQPLA